MSVGLEIRGSIDCAQSMMPYPAVKASLIPF